MSFLDEVDSLRSKSGLSKAKLPVVAGLCFLLVLALVGVGYFAWNAVTTPGVTIEQEDAIEVSTEEESAASIYVHVTGAVVNPGMYELSQGSRVQDAITAAGGFSEDAFDQSINLARELTDGEQIVVGSTADQSTTTTESGTQSAATATGEVNINLADAETLMTLDGIGEATAAKIIAYRDANGSFATIEEIKEVPGIGDKKYEAIKDSITV